ncbi:RNA 2',3'-cyclic phosphodiesterase [Paenirhodobacter sp.]|uniref:RNA 2',3'-cyclic phosphodiesterase n=1 Tax=Paenirhodobacter sp. TaxID=1965326 RepID=UPI003B3CCD0E
MRLFVALAVPEAVAGQIVALQEMLGTGRLVPEENLHLTLAFLGDVAGADLADLDLALADLRSPAPMVELAGIDLWDEALVIGVRANPVLEALARKVAVAVRGVVEMPRRRFRPHVTLARVRPGDAVRVGRFLSARADAVLTPFAAEGFTLYRSHLRAEGPLYEPLAEYPLG